jgi:membrane protein
VISVIYRYGPSREAFEWRSAIYGSLLAAALWVAGSAVFSWYVSSFRSFVDLYGSLSAVIGFMVWIWLSLIAVLIGAELDSALMKDNEAEVQGGMDDRRGT